MSIFKESFKKGVKEQIVARQNAIIKRTPTAIQYYNARNAWIRMTSAVNVGEDDGALAKKHILLGGTLFNSNSGYVPRVGVGKGNQAYSTLSPGGNEHRLGIRPMPGIVSIDVKSKSAYGSLREVVVNFQCWDIRQLEDLELLYMRPGYTVLIEWGWAPYLNNNETLQSSVDFVDDVINGTSSKEVIWNKIFEKASSNGNYDALYGFVKNYSWSAREDGGYDCNVTVISMGEVLESLKVNYGPYNSDVGTKGVFNVLFTPFEKGSTVVASYSQNIIAGICNELYLIVKNKEFIENYEEKVVKLNNSDYTFFRFDVDIANSQNDTADNDFDDNNQIYILLKDFIDILNKYVLVKDIKSDTPLIKVSVNEGAHMSKDNEPLLCLAHPLQLSIDPSICLIKNDSWQNPSSLGFDAGFGDDFSTLKSIMAGLKTNYFSTNNSELGVIGNIFVNLGYLYSLAVNNNIEAQDKKEKNEIALFDYLKNIMAGINTSIGSIATFDIFSDPIDSVARIIDVNYTNDNSRQQAYEDAFIIQMGNIQSIVRTYKLESQIFPEQSTMVAIGAQSQGGVLGSDTNTLVDFNQNLIDRIIPKKDAPTSPQQDDPKEEIKQKLQNLKGNMEIIVDFINEIDADWWAFGFGQGDFDVNDSSKYANALKDIIVFYRTYVKNDTKNRAIIPTKLSIEMDGIGGIVIGNLFRIPEDILPRGYKGDGAGPSKIAYIVTGLGHTIQSNDWVTKIDSQFILLDEPKALYTISDLQLLQAINRAAASGNVDEAVKKLETASSGAASTTSTGGTPVSKDDKPRKKGKCDKTLKIVTQANSPGLNIPARSSWDAVKGKFPIINGPVPVKSVGTPFDSGNDFAYKMNAVRVYKTPSRKINYIVLHYTVSSKMDPLFHYKNTWEGKPTSADFTLSRNGQLAGIKNYKNYTSWHFGPPTWKGAGNLESIGIEIESYGPAYYCQSTGKFLDDYGQELDKNEIALTKTYRGHNIWHALTDVQISAVANLIIALYNDGSIGDKVQFVQGMKSTGRYDILWPDVGLRKKPPPGIITHGTGRDPGSKMDTFPQSNLLTMLDDLPNLVKNYTKTSIGWKTS